MVKPLILVTGATGTVGTQLIPLLVEAGVRVRGLTRDPEKARKFGQKVEIVTGDLEQPETLASAFAGVDKVLVLAVGLQLAILEGNAYVAAKKAGVSHIVKLSGRHVNADFMAVSPHAQAHAESEQHLQSLGIPWTILRPSAFATNFLMWVDRKQNGIFLPAGQGRDAFIDPADIADCAAKLLTTSGQDGRIHEITGSEPLSFAQVANKISAATGRKIAYHDIPEGTARQGMAASGLPESYVQMILLYFAAVKHGNIYPPTAAVADLLGRPPGSFDGWARNHVALLQ